MLICIKGLFFNLLLIELTNLYEFIQVLAGARQIGKTPFIHQVLATLSFPWHYVSADEITVRDSFWLQQQWDLARLHARHHQGAVLVLDEIQKVPEWSTLVKKLWDEDTKNKIPLKIVLLGSATTPL